jgi:hypothetical protein
MAVLALLLVPCLLATAGAAQAAQPTGPPTLTYHAGFGGELDPGLNYENVPAAGNTTQYDWRLYTWMQVVIGTDPGQQSWFELYDWNFVMFDQPDGTAGWHYHWGTGIVSSVDPSLYWPKLPPRSTWLWTSEFTGATTPAGVHTITEDWTGCNAYKGLKACCIWQMSNPNYLHFNGKVWLLD